MTGVKQEPGAPAKQAGSMTLRQNTPLTSNDSPDTMRGEASTGPSPAHTVMTEAASNEAVASCDTAMSDVPVTEDALYLFGRKGRELIQGIQKLDCLGIDTTLPSLPKVVVVGDQSAGKSSIIEAMSDITLPRSEGTCTRCPFQITTHPTQGGESHWSCSVSLHVKYHFLPGHISGEAVGLNDWKNNRQTDVCLFATITNKADLELTLRRAQVAILNPTKNWRAFTAYSAMEIAKFDYEVEFSPNSICLEINAPNLLELSFYDLPGAINVMHDESQDYLSGLVESLLKSYLSDPQALVVIACPASQDIETGTAFKYLRNCKASGRAIGILTKPDLVVTTESRIHSLERVFQGKDFKLDGGWFTTKQLSQSQLNDAVRPTYEQARAEESHFFATVAPWSTRLSACADRFGIANLQEAVSRRHIQHILASLPNIVDRIGCRLQQVQNELKEYPEKATNPGLEVIHDIDQVVQAIVDQCSVDSKTSGSRDKHKQHMKQLATQLAKQLAEQLEDAAPKVDFKTPGYVPPAVDISDDESPDETPSKRNKLDNDRAVNATPRRATPSSRQRTSRTPVVGSKRKATATPNKVSAMATYSVTFRLDEVKQGFDLAPSAQLPDYADARITCDLAKESLGCFSSFVQHALEKFEAVVKKMLDNCLSKSLAQRKGTLLFRETSTIMHSLLGELFDQETEWLHHFVACITNRPITLGNDWSAKREEQHRLLKQGRAKKRVEEHYETLQHQGSKIPSIEERKKKTTDAGFLSSLASPAYARELNELALPLTFYQLASGQLVDTVARSLDYLIYQLEDRMKTQLHNGLRPTDFEYSASLLANDRKREEMRADLEAEQSKLEEALGELKLLSSADA